jgi:hypothetical protein
VDDEGLQSIVRAASSPYKLVWQTGCDVLFQLAVTQENCRQAIDRMTSSGKSAVRFNAVAFLADAALPESLVLSVIERGLSDRSSRVRWKAVEQAERLGFRQLVPRLEAMMASEAHADVKDCLALHLPLMRDGFRLEAQPDGSAYWLTVRGPRRSIISARIPAGRFSDAYLREAIERLRKGESLQ